MSRERAGAEGRKDGGGEYLLHRSVCGVSREPQPVQVMLPPLWQVHPCKTSTRRSKKPPTRSAQVCRVNRCSSLSSLRLICASFFPHRDRNADSERERTDD